MTENEIFVNDLIQYLESKGYVNDRGRDGPDEDGDMFYSLGKMPIRVEIKLNWHKRFKWFESLVIDIMDCSNEEWSDGGFIGWMNQKSIFHSIRPFPLALVNDLEHRLQNEDV